MTLTIGSQVVDASGKTYEVTQDNMADLQARIDSGAAKSVGADLAGNETTLSSDVLERSSTTTSTAGTTGETKNSAEITALESRLAQLQTDRKANTDEINKLQEEIDSLAKEVEEEIKAAVKTFDDNVADSQNDYEQGIEALIAGLKNGSITQEDFDNDAAGLKGKMEGTLSADQVVVLSKIASANFKISTIELLAGQIKNFQARNTEIDTQMNTIGTQIETIKNPPVADKPEVTVPDGLGPGDTFIGEDGQKYRLDENCNPCPDPIGFKTEDGKRYDFFIDRDSDGQLSDASEFLGADKGWAEMEEYMDPETGELNSEALSKMSVVVTDKDGNQEVKPASEVFASLVISDRKEGDAADRSALGDDADDSRVSLASTFNISGSFVDDGDEATDESINTTGYQTNDTLSYLDENYGKLFSGGGGAEAIGTGSAAGLNLSNIANALGISQDDLNAMNFQQAQEAVFGKDNAALIQNLKDQLEQALIHMNFSAEAIAEVTELAYVGAKMEKEAVVADIQAKIDAQKAEDAAADQRITDARAADEAAATAAAAAAETATGAGAGDPQAVTTGNDASAADINPATGQAWTPEELAALEQ